MVRRFAIVDVVMLKGDAVLVAHIEKLRAQLEESASRIDALPANGTIKSASGILLVRLRAKYAAAREKLKELEDAGDENWEFYKTDIWIAWYELENALQDVHRAALSEVEKQTEQLKITKQKGRQGNRRANDVDTDCPGKRISTPTDVLRKKRWIDLNVPQGAAIESTQSSLVAKPALPIKIEKDEAGQ